MKKTNHESGKSNSQLRTVFVVLGIITIVFIICMTLFSFFDIGMNGVFRQWIQNNFMYWQERTDPDTGNVTLINQIQWGSVKLFILISLIFILCVCSLTVYFICRYHNGKYHKNCVMDLSYKIHDYMKYDVPADEVFHGEDTEISMQLVEFKAQTNQKEILLKQEAERKNDLITYLAHDLKTPLTSVIGYLSLLDEAADMPQEQREKYLHITLDKALRLEQLINEFFEITRYNLQQIGLEKEHIDLYYMLIQLEDEFYPILQEHHNKICLDAPENLSVYADADKLARVFNNLIKNAVAYSYPDTEITVKAERVDDKIIIRVSNHGRTIPAAKLDRLFEKFFRMDEARTTNSGGAGLGLAIAKEIVNLHGGTITASSEQEITTFTVELPE